MSDGIKRLERFIVAHGSCGGEVTTPDPNEKDLGRSSVWIAARCSGCGTTIREEVSESDLLLGFEQLLELAGVSPDDMPAHNDPEGAESILRRVKAAPGVLLELLQRIRGAQARESQN